jgi:hypothetical protein
LVVRASKNDMAVLGCPHRRAERAEKVYAFMYAIAVFPGSIRKEHGIVRNL